MPAGSTDRPRWRLAVLVACGLAALLLGFGGGLLRPLDGLSHFRAHLGVLLLALGLLALARRRGIAGPLALAGAIGAAVSVAPYLLPRPDPAPDAAGPTYALLQMNVLYKASDPAEALRRIGETRPDVVTLQELTPEWADILQSLRDTYPHQFICREPGPAGRIDAGILSRRPFVAQGLCDVEHAFAAQRVDFNGTELTVAAHHQLWPWPAGQWRRLDRIADLLGALPTPVLLGGDFNAVPWSAFLRRYETLTGASAVRGIGSTWGPMAGGDALARWFGLPIDNLLASPRVEIRSVERLPATTSDHLPVLLRFALPRPVPPPTEPVTAALMP